MRGMTRAAKKANGLRQACTHCPILKRYNICPAEISMACNDAFVDGFKKGVKWTEEQIRQKWIEQNENYKKEIKKWEEKNRLDADTASE